MTASRVPSVSCRNMFRRDRLPGWLGSVLRGLLDHRDAGLDLVFPRACAVCGHAVSDSGRYLCWDCKGRIEYQSVRLYCVRCGRSFAGAMTMPFCCGACRREPPAYDAARSAAHFRDPVRPLLLAFKYHGATWLRGDLVDLLDACVRHHYGPDGFDAICPVPLHARRWRERGYNQADLLGVDLARRFGVPCFPDALRRIRYTETQTRLNRATRRHNIRGVFGVGPVLRPWIEGRRMLVVDDVMTTGATVGDAARALKQAGASQVLVASVARD